MAWSVVQSAKGTANTTATNTVTFTPTNGNKVIVFAAGATNATATCADNHGNALTQVATKVLSTYVTIYLFAYDATGSPTSFTVTWSTATGNSIMGQEVSGLATGNTLSAMVDGTAGTLSGAASPTGSATYSSTASNEYLLTGFGDWGNSATATQPSGYTLDTNSVNGSADADCCLAYKNSTGGAETSSWSYTTTGNEWCTFAVAFKLGSSGTTANAGNANVTVAASGPTPSVTAALSTANVTVASPNATGGTQTVASAGNAAVTVSASAPSPSVTALPTTAQVTVTGYNPSASTGSSTTATAGNANVTAAGYNPTVSVTDRVDLTANVSVGAYNPTIGGNANASPSTANVSVSSPASTPAVSFTSGSANVAVSSLTPLSALVAFPGIGNVTVTSPSPSVALVTSPTVTPTTAAVAVAAYNVSITGILAYVDFAAQVSDARWTASVSTARWDAAVTVPRWDATTGQNRWDAVLGTTWR